MCCIARLLNGFHTCAAVCASICAWETDRLQICTANKHLATATAPAPAIQFTIEFIFVCSYAVFHRWTVKTKRKTGEHHETGECENHDKKNRRRDEVQNQFFEFKGYYQIHLSVAAAGCCLLMVDAIVHAQVAAVGPSNAT